MCGAEAPVAHAAMITCGCVQVWLLGHLQEDERADVDKMQGITAHPPRLLSRA
jgi:hypothetical protein